MIMSAQLSIEGFVRDSQAAIGELSMYAGDTQLTVEVDNEVLSTSSEGAAVLAERLLQRPKAKLIRLNPTFKVGLAEEGGVPTFDSAISGDDDSGGAAESDTSEETDVSGEIGVTSQFHLQFRVFSKPKSIS